ncbi:hypothetical protein BHC44_08790 [Snodgrassella alvi]|uniref:Uncharacterized protein n=1 Tax=Snodgrassella alvi TaxID=1196083 RepID=A0A2N9XXN3_9NEIS|nr:hypothetical protein [Snodgrassella alvi]PIT52315.1 hypothetical protein BHC44_08790 [Snodgrassella alvi]PIT54745.1 hypothetical protein BHC49_07925 [Snodgrassella alvi]PIT56065.1 hypothetical protein BHC49_04845 [Snodgrassella alvi]PIT56775.1 hypothetical protein BHC49_04150 [Snodgrassella alvi]PIT56914.1 hypothetical protein BHC49_04065 [Snodgrassella alvi]
MLLHIPAREIDDWPVSEFNRYLNYYNRFGFPQWRIEQYLAYNTLVTARAAGNDEIQLQDLLLPDLADDETDSQDVADSGGDDDADEVDAFLDSLD